MCRNSEDALLTYVESVSGLQWYLDVIAAADLIDQSPVKGCMVIKPYGMVSGLCL